MFRHICQQLFISPFYRRASSKPCGNTIAKNQRKKLSLSRSPTLFLSLSLFLFCFLCLLLSNYVTYVFRWKTALSKFFSGKIRRDFFDQGLTFAKALRISSLICELFNLKSLWRRIPKSLYKFPHASMNQTIVLLMQRYLLSGFFILLL